jgi:hypothetical protein
MEHTQATNAAASLQIVDRVERKLDAASRRAAAGETADALRLVQEELTSLPSGGVVPPEVLAQLQLRLLSERSALRRDLAEGACSGPHHRPPQANNRIGRWQSWVLVAGLTIFTLVAGAAAALADAAAPGQAGTWLVAAGVAAVVLVCLAVFGPERSPVAMTPGKDEPLHIKDPSAG